MALHYIVCSLRCTAVVVLLYDCVNLCRSFVTTELGSLKIPGIYICYVLAAVLISLSYRYFEVYCFSVVVLLGSSSSSSSSSNVQMHL